MKKLVKFILFFSIVSNFTFWIYTISFTNYIDTLKTLNQNLHKIPHDKISKINKIVKLINKTKSLKCNFFQTESYFLINPICFIKNELPSISKYTAINKGFKYIFNFSNKFELNKTSFLYSWSKIIWKNWYFENYNLFKKLINTNSSGENIINIILLLKNYYIQIPKQFIYRKILDQFSYYVSTKNLTNRWKCRKHNYLLAIKQLDWIKLLPWEKLNYNKILAKLNNNLYCKELWNKYKHYLFYEWVCWASTQLFRNSLLNPNLVITKRYNHTKRYAKYYSNYIYWDDASIYEWIKQFEIKNIWNYPIYFKTLNKNENQIYLVSIIPTKILDKSVIIRKQIWKLKALVWKVVFDKNFNEKYSQFWISNYCCKVW